MYRVEQFNSGLRLVSHPMKGRDSASLGVWVGVGGRYETDEIKGSAHFLEHILFKGSKNYSCEGIKENIEGVGGALNAFTSEEQTCYYAKIPSCHVEKTLDVLTDMVLYPKIASVDVQKERTVILEEIKMYKDLPQYYVTELLDELVWPGHPLGKSLAGTVESVSSTSSAQLKKFHARHYNAGNIVVSVCGGVNHSDIVKQLSRKFKPLKSETAQSFIPVDNIQAQPQLRFFKKETEQMHLALGMPAYDENNDDRYALGLLNVILGGNMSSRLFVEVREKRGLAYSISSSAKYLHDTGVFTVRAGVDNKKLPQTVELILKELQKISHINVSASEFTRAKDYLLGQLVLGLEDTMDHMLWIGESLISRNRVRTLKQVMDKITKLKRDDLLRVAKEVFNPAKFNLAVIGSVEPSQEKILHKLFQIKQR